MWWSVIVGAFIAWFLASNKRYLWFYILYRTIGRDIRGVCRFTRMNILLWKWERNQQTPAKILHTLARKHPDRIAFYFEDETWTFAEIERLANQTANYFKSQGFKRGDTVALLLENRPEYPAFWIGLSKIGVVTALINTNLKNDPLSYSIEVAKSKGLIYGSDYAKDVETILPKLEKVRLYQFNEKSKADEPLLESSTNLMKNLETSPNNPLEHEMAKGFCRDKLVYIFTSGTTGLPKAAVITNLRFLFMATGMTCMIKVQQDDIIYNPLPLYHSAGGMVGVGQTILQGVPMVLRRKFSASNFWKDCVKYNCTLAQYIGEICRYILAAQKNDPPLKHKVRAMFGNGVKVQVWEKFTKLYDVKLFEFYGATEGNSNLINFDSTLGAVGFLPRYASAVYPVTLVRCDEATGEPIRDKNGFCIRCKIDQPGALLGQINPKKAVQSFTGYADKKATDKKIIENVFRKGDIYFNSGDILVQDMFGYFYFKDRTGDTYRWKGENVASSEVEAVISSVVELKDAVVYGVEIPGTEGRAGMVAIVDQSKTLDLEGLAKGLKANLPAYAQPIFVRVLESVPLTGTFKLKKTDLQKEGFDVTVIKNDVYFYDGKVSKYVPLTKDVYSRIMDGTIRL